MATDVMDNAKERMNKTISVLQQELGAARRPRQPAGARPHSGGLLRLAHADQPARQHQRAGAAHAGHRPVGRQAHPGDREGAAKVRAGHQPRQRRQGDSPRVPGADGGAAQGSGQGRAQKGEESKVAIRAIRRDANEQIKAQKKNNELTEDDQKHLEEKIQKLTDELIRDIDRIIAEKEKEILSV